MLKVGKIQTVECPLGVAVQPVKFLNKLNKHHRLQTNRAAEPVEVIRIYHCKS